MASLKIFSFVAVAMVLSMSHSQAHREGNWGDETVPYTLGPEMMTKLRFYFHDIVVGDNPTAIRIAEAPGTNSSPTFFGALVMIDDPLTEGPDINSRLVGRAQGFYGLSGMDEISLIMGMSLVFTANEKFNGSTISVFSRNPVTHTEREFAIVGGTGYFKFARGFISARTYNGTGPNPIVQYSCTIVHPRKISFY
ncbi:dirigent protein 2-like [Papaver somniferum]|uniref:dirigent protein 2-like n=1 Tax=Papaver somniferum TaxID=3469 RepID=UPI000E6F63C9|nr:dirigent protein 2-like [Papaver somniferum]